MLSKLLVILVIIASITIYGSLAFRCDGAKLANERMTGGFEVIHGMAVSARAIIVLAATSQMPASHAQPQVSAQFALTTVSKGLAGNFLCTRLVKGQRMFALL